MKPLTLEETALKEEMKERCLAKGQYKDEKAKDKFKMLCPLEDFGIQYWELQQENKQLKENAENNDKVVDKVNWENQLLKKENKQLKDNWNKLKEIVKSQSSLKQKCHNESLWFEVDELLNKIQELEGDNNE